MFRFIRILSLIPLSLAFCLVISVSFAQNPTLKLASDEWPPFSSSGDNNGVAITLVNYALQQMKVKHDFVITSFDSVLTGLNTGKYDGSAALWKTPERESYLLFSEPYLQNQLILVGKKGSNINILTSDGLSGKKVGIVSNYAYDNTFLDQQDIHFVKSVSDQENLEKLLSGKIDYMLVDALLIEYLKKYQANDVNKYLEVGSHPFQRKSLYFAVSKSNPDAQNIINNFNREIRKMMRNGTYNKILNLDWVEVDVDNDGIAEIVGRNSAGGNTAPVSAYNVDSTDTHSNVQPGYIVDGIKYNSWDNVPEEYKKIEIHSTQDKYLPAVKFKF